MFCEAEARHEQLVGEIKALRDSVEELYLVLDHLWRNRNELRDLLNSNHAPIETYGIPENLCCADCNARIGSLAEALQEGWSELARDDTGDWSYLGVCPRCLEQQLADGEPDSRTSDESADERQSRPDVVRREAPECPKQSQLFRVRVPGVVIGRPQSRHAKVYAQCISPRIHDTASRFEGRDADSMSDQDCLRKLA